MKILCLKQNITDPQTLNNGIDLVIQKCSSIGLSLDFTFKDTTFPFASIKTSSSNFNQVDGYVVDSAQVFQQAKTFNIDFDLALLIYDWTKITPQPTNPSDGGRAISIPIQWYVTYPNVLCEFILHEMCHALFSASGQPDTTHVYPPNFGQKPRSDYYLYLILSLKAYWNAFNGVVTPTTPFKPDVTITRLSDNGTECLGQLRIGDKPYAWGCDTLERSYKNNQVNISAIPVGQYQVKRTFSLKFGFVYEVQSVVGRSGIYLHEGNFFFNSEGCILLGSLPKDINSDGNIDLQNSKLIRQAFQNYMKWQPFSLLIQ
jgi:hypothetical protein